MGICDENCNCYVIGERGILVTGTGDADTPYVVSPDTSRDLTLHVTTRDDLPTLTDDDLGTFAYVGDTGIVFVWRGFWEPVGSEWSRADFGGLTISGAPTNSTGFVLAGTGAFSIWAKGYIETEVPATTNVVFQMYLKRMDSGALLDGVLIDAFNASAGDETLFKPFSLLATIGLGAPTDVTGIVIEYWILSGVPNTALLNDGRIFAQRLSFLDTTTAYP